jgi:hypothetical protein
MASASEWKRAALRAAEAVELQLPSGVTIRARRPDPLQLAMWGRLPFSLTRAAVGADVAAEPTEVEQAVELARFMRDLLLFCCVAPRVSLTPAGEDEIHPRDIPLEDWTFIVRWAMRVEASVDLKVVLSSEKETS